MLGVGPLEIGVILLVAFLVLGPTAFLDVARKAGKLLHDLRGGFTDIASSVNMEPDPPPARRDSVPPAQDSEDTPVPRHPA